MQRNQLTTVGVIASLVCGAAIAILALLNVDGLGTVAAIGGILLGLMWAIIGMVRSRNAA